MRVMVIGLGGTGVKTLIHVKKSYVGQGKWIRQVILRVCSCLVSIRV